jgi:hypothetical protein
MRLKTRLAAAFTVLASLLAFSAGGRTPPGGVAGAVAMQQSQGGLQLSDIQYYEILFRRVAYLQERALAREQKGQDGTRLRFYVANRLGLDPDEDRIVHEAAFGCLKEVNRLDARAREIIQQERAKFPRGANTAVSGRPTPPPILASLHRERDDAILRAREALKNAFGEARFASLDMLVKDYLTELRAAQRPTPQATCGGGLCEAGNIPWCRACCNEIRDICYNDAYSAYAGCVAGCDPEDQECLDTCYQNYLQARSACYYDWVDCYFCCWQ